MNECRRFIPLGVFLLCLMGTGMARGQTEAVRLYIEPHSTVAIPDIMKNLASKCPNATITINPQESDFMLQASGWSGSYKFTVFQRGGTVVYSAGTVTLSNAVKDVCHFLQGSQAQLSGFGTGSDNLAPQHAQTTHVSATSLNTVRHDLTNARDKLLKAANQSDYVRRAIAQLDQALDDTKQAVEHVNDDFAVAAPMAIPNFGAAPPPTQLTNFMLYSSLDSLGLAYDALNRVPGGGLGGYRALVNNDIAAAAATLVNGIDSYNAKRPY